MFKSLALAAACLAGLASAAGAQTLDRTLSFDAGLGVKYTPEYIGSDNLEAGPWLILKNADADRDLPDGLTISPSLNLVSKRDADDYDALRGMKDIGYAGEVGFKLSWRQGEMTSYGALRQGFGGHHGTVGEVGAKYRIEYNDKLTLWTGGELGLGSSDFTDTYFGVTGSEALATGKRAYDPDGGAYVARLTLEARYELMPDTALLGRVSYGRLIGDAADSPLVETRNQPSISIGIARRVNFRF